MGKKQRQSWLKNLTQASIYIMTCEKANGESRTFSLFAFIINSGRLEKVIRESLMNTPRLKIDQSQQSYGLRGVYFEESDSYTLSRS